MNQPGWVAWHLQRIIPPTTKCQCGDAGQGLPDTFSTCSDSSSVTARWSCSSLAEPYSCGPSIHKCLHAALTNYEQGCGRWQVSSQSSRFSNLAPMNTRIRRLQAQACLHTRRNNRFTVLARFMLRIISAFGVGSSTVTIQRADMSCALGCVSESLVALCSGLDSFCDAS